MKPSSHSFSTYFTDKSLVLTCEDINKNAMTDLLKMSFNC